MSEPLTAEEAVYQALLMLTQKRPRATAPQELIRLLEMDGFTVATLDAARPSGEMTPDHFHRHPDDSYSPCDCAAGSVLVGHSSVTQRVPAGCGPGQGAATDPAPILGDVDEEGLATMLREANVTGVERYASWVAYAREIIRLAAEAQQREGAGE